MSYKVLYRKYRPSNFNDIVDQKFITDTLKESIINNKISHAYIFSGPKGTGKTSTARVFAKAINCLNPIDGEPCCKCESCLNFDSNPDIIELDAASNNKVEDIREIINSVKLAPNNSKFKIYIIDEVHMLTNSASNAFLLTLEEPPSHAVFILATTNPESLPVTILSRCQQFAFSKISKKALVKQIKYVLSEEKVEMEDTIIDEIANLSDGGLRDALSILDQLITLNKPINIDLLTEQFGIVSDSSIENLINYILNNDINKIQDSFNQFRDYGISEKSFSSKLICFITRKICSLKQENCVDKISQLKSIVYELLKVDFYRSNFNYYDISEMIIISNLELNMKNISQEINLKDNKQENLENKDKFTQSQQINISSEPNEITQQEPKEEKIPVSNKKEKCNSNIIDIRINNSFYKASKIMKKHFEEKFDDISSLLKNDTDLYSLFIDLGVGLVSPTNVLLYTDTEATANLLNNKSEILSEKLGSKKKYVFVSKDKWNDLKENYIKNKDIVDYEYIEEPVIQKSSELEDIANDIFGENNIIMEDE